MIPTRSDYPLFFVDGPNICGVLGHVLDRKPQAHEWPRWNRVLVNLERLYRTVKGHYVLNGNYPNDRLLPFYRALKQIGYSVPTPTGHPAGGDGDPVDHLIREGIDTLLTAAKDGPTRVIIAAHDRGYAPHLRRFIERGGAVTVVGLREWLAPTLIDIERVGAVFLDIEHDLGGFDTRFERPFHA